jgi:hypothetical protein
LTTKYSGLLERKVSQDGLRRLLGKGNYNMTKEEITELNRFIAEKVMKRKLGYEGCGFDEKQRAYMDRIEIRDSCNYCGNLSLAFEAFEKLGSDIYMKIQAPISRGWRVAFEDNCSPPCIASTSNISLATAICKCIRGYVKGKEWRNRNDLGGDTEAP